MLPYLFKFNTAKYGISWKSCLGTWARLRKNKAMTVCPSVRLSVCPHGTTRFPLDEIL